jgi:hypothetical protein
MFLFSTCISDVDEVVAAVEDESALDETAALFKEDVVDDEVC